LFITYDEECFIQWCSNVQLNQTSLQTMMLNLGYLYSVQRKWRNGENNRLGLGLG